MMTFLADNAGTLLISGIVLALIVLILWYMRKNRKKGRSPCGCDCGGCSCSDMCHKK